MSKDILKELFETIQSRKGADPESSYTASLFKKGVEKIAQKIGEEAMETAIEAIKGDRDKLKEESADLLFHLMVLWAHQGLTPDDILDVLQKRSGISGIDEKNSRGK